MNQKNNGRRDFLRKSAVAGAMTLGFSQIISSAYGETPVARIALNKNDVLLFQGDSITDARRKRDEKNANSTNGLGTGYALLATSKLLRQHASKALQVYNRGISGNKVYQLAERWDDECLDLRPAVLSILIGVNDFWHMVDGKYSGTIETYRNDYRALLQRTKDKLPDVKLIIGEPFAVNGVKSVNDKWFPAFDEYRLAARDLATQFKASFIPYQSIFEKAAKVAPASYWTYDGVHPSLPGSQLMAEAFLGVVS